MGKVIYFYKNAKKNKYRVDKTYKGHRISEYFETESDARNYLKLKMNQIDACQLLDAGVNTLLSTFDKYKNIPDWTEQTREKELGRLKQFGSIINEDLAKLTSREFQSVVGNVKRDVDKGKLASTTAKKRFSILRRLLDYAMAEGYCTRFDTTFINISTKGNRRSEKIENNFMTENDFRSLINGIKTLESLKGSTVSVEFFIFVLNFLYFTGMRINEARSIKFSDLRKDDLTQYIYLHGQLADNANEFKSYLKNKDLSRKIYIEQSVYDMFITFLKKNNYKEDEYVFDFKHNGMPFTRNSLSKTFKYTVATLKENGKLSEDFNEDITSHGFRRSNVKYLFDRGMSIEAAANNLGHTVGIMLNVYDRFRAEHDLPKAFLNKKGENL